MPEKQARKGATEYVVLQKLDGHEDAWTPVGTAPGHTKQEACRAVSRANSPDGAEYDEGKYKAVPARSWSDKPDFSVRNEPRVVPIFGDDEEPSERQPAAAAAGGGTE